MLLECVERPQQQWCTTTHQSQQLSRSRINKKNSLFRILYLPQLGLMVDTASPLTFINQKTWQDLRQPKLEPTSKVLEAFEAQPIKPIGYFETHVQHTDDPNQCAVLKIYVSHRGINLIGRDGQVKLHITVDPSQFVSAVEVPPRSLQEVIKVNDTLLKPQLGSCNAFKATLLLSTKVLQSEEDSFSSPTCSRSWRMFCFMKYRNAT